MNPWRSRPRAAAASRIYAACATALVSRDRAEVKPAERDSVEMDFGGTW